MRGRDYKPVACTTTTGWTRGDLIDWGCKAEPCNTSTGWTSGEGKLIDNDYKPVACTTTTGWTSGA